MKNLSQQQLEVINGGGAVKEIYEDVRDFVNNNLEDFVQGIKDGWNSL